MGARTTVWLLGRGEPPDPSQTSTHLRALLADPSIGGTGPGWWRWLVGRFARRGAGARLLIDRAAPAEAPRASLCRELQRVLGPRLQVMATSRHGQPGLEGPVRSIQRNERLVLVPTRPWEPIQQRTALARAAADAAVQAKAQVEPAPSPDVLPAVVASIRAVLADRRPQRAALLLMAPGRGWAWPWSPPHTALQDFVGQVRAAGGFRDRPLVAEVLAGQGIHGLRPRLGPLATQLAARSPDLVVGLPLGFDGQHHEGRAVAHSLLGAIAAPLAGVPVVLAGPPEARPEWVRAIVGSVHRAEQARRWMDHRAVNQAMREAPWGASS